MMTFEPSRTRSVTFYYRSTVRLITENTFAEFYLEQCSL